MSITAKSKDIKIEMIKKGLSSRALAKAIKKHESYLSYILRGQRSPSAQTAKDISEALGKEVTELFNINEKEEVV